MEKNFTMTVILQATPKDIYEAWMSSEGHSEMTGSPAVVDDKVGGKYSAWENYIFGKTLELELFERILQSWRTTEFPEGALDSQIEILLKAVKGGTKLTLIHSGLPEGTLDEYRHGWEEFYFTPMKAYFG